MEIKLFGITKDIIGNTQLSIGADENIHTVAELKAWLKLKYPAFNNLSSIAIAIDNEYAEDNTLVHEKNEIALIPPVSGG